MYNYYIIITPASYNLLISYVHCTSQSYQDTYIKKQKNNNMRDL